MTIPPCPCDGCATLPAVGPRLVDCDEKCGALDEPVTPDEVRAAYEHWRYHGCLCGCSHGC